jgi:hypothetical protein
MIFGLALNQGGDMRKVEMTQAPGTQRCWIAVDLKSGEPVLRLHDRQLLERICTSLEWKIIQPLQQRQRSAS